VELAVRLGGVDVGDAEVERAMMARMGSASSRPPPEV
jgi:hypothetical protein